MKKCVENLIVTVVFMLFAISCRCFAADMTVCVGGTSKGAAITREVLGKTEIALDEIAAALGCSNAEISQGTAFAMNGKKAELWDNSDIARIDMQMIACPSAVVFAEGHWWAELSTARKIFDRLCLCAGKKGTITFTNKKLTVKPQPPKAVISQAPDKQKTETKAVKQPAADNSLPEKTAAVKQAVTEVSAPQKTVQPALETANTDSAELNGNNAVVSERAIRKVFTKKHPVVVIDAGHGAHDPGAIGNRTREKDINLLAALKLGDVLKKYGIKVLYTRSTDVFLKLQARTDFANKNNADVFVSLHCNSIAKANNSVKGIEIYIMASPRDKDSLNLAIRENKEVSGNVSSVSALQQADKKTQLLLKILGDMQQNNKINESTELTESLDKAIKAEGLRVRKVSQAPFFVLRGAGMPAVLIEMGYLSSVDDAAKLNTEAYRNRLVYSFAEGIVNYIKTHVKL